MSIRPPSGAPAVVRDSQFDGVDVEPVDDGKMMVIVNARFRPSAIVAMRVKPSELPAPAAIMPGDIVAIDAVELQRLDTGRDRETIRKLRDEVRRRHFETFGVKCLCDLCDDDPGAVGGT